MDAILDIGGKLQFDGSRMRMFLRRPTIDRAAAKKLLPCSTPKETFA